MKYPRPFETTSCPSDQPCRALLAVLTAGLLFMALGVFGGGGKLWMSATTPTLKVQGR